MAHLGRQPSGRLVAGIAGHRRRNMPDRFTVGIRTGEGPVVTGQTVAGRDALLRIEAMPLPALHKTRRWLAPTDRSGPVAGITGGSGRNVSRRLARRTGADTGMATRAVARRALEQALGMTAFTGHRLVGAIEQITGFGVIEDQRASIGVLRLRKSRCPLPEKNQRSEQAHAKKTKYLPQDLSL